MRYRVELAMAAVTGGEAFSAPRNAPYMSANPAPGVYAAGAHVGMTSVHCSSAGTMMLPFAAGEAGDVHHLPVSLCQFGGRHDGLGVEPFADSRGCQTAHELLPHHVFEITGRCRLFDCDSHFIIPLKVT